MSQFLHNPALILTDSIKQPNLQLSIWLYQPHSSFVLALLHCLPAHPFSLFPCPPLHFLTLNKIFFIFFASSASSFSLSHWVFFFSTLTHSVSASPRYICRIFLQSQIKSKLFLPKQPDYVVTFRSAWAFRQTIQNTWCSPAFSTCKITSLFAWAVLSSNLV